MAKKAAAGKGGLVIAQEIYSLVDANNSITGPEVLKALKDKFPSVKFNEASCQVAFANARKKLGLARTLKRRPAKGLRRGGRPGRPPRAARAAGVAAIGIDMSLLQSAKALLQQCGGDVNVAISAMKQIAALQMN
jgi:hypothetical protein